MEYAIREVTTIQESDVDVINSLLEQLTTKKIDFSTTDLANIVNEENSHLFVLDVKGDTIGMLTVGVYKTPTGLKAWIEDVVIDQQYRGMGLGKMLMLHVIDFIKSFGGGTIMLTSNGKRIVANELYRNLGFERKETNVYKMNI